MTCDTPVSKALRHSFNVLKMVAGGAPIAPTLQAVAAMCAQAHPDMRFGILLLENEHLSLAADHNLLGEDRLVLSRLSFQSPTSALAQLHHFSAYVKPLITPAAEVLGALVAFGTHRPFDKVALHRELDEVCWMATLAIEQKHLSEELAYRVHHDALTHLWNRVWMEEEIFRVFTLASRQDANVGLAILGVDRFRIINDVLGSQVGNELLCQIAGRIASRMPPSFSLARGSGDEFMVLMPDVDTPEQVDIISHRFLECFDGSFHIGDHELAIKASVGNTVVKASACASTELEAQAYIALRYAKKRARGKVVAFHPSSMIRVPPERLVMEQHLRFALQKREFEIYYQPQIHLSSGRLVGVEALLRWKHPALGFISPAVFIPLAEEIGLIEEIGDWVLDQVIKQCQEWRESSLSEIRISVNVSALQFARTDFGAWVGQKLESAQIQPGNFELEITESAIMTNFEHGQRQMNILRDFGLTLAIDDFGTGHSSLAYLQQLPIQRLKIDRMFVKEVVSREDRPPLLASIVQMAHALGLSIVAEGAETAEQVSVLLDLACEEVQGFFFSKPRPANDFSEWAKSRQSIQAKTACPLPTVQSGL